MDTVIKTAVADIRTQLDFPSVAYAVEHPSDLTHGDYACNIALVLAKEVGEAPRAIAEQFAPLLAEAIEYVERVEVAGPGFLNFYLHRDFFSAEIERATTLEQQWGRSDDWFGVQVVVEYTDPNPFKEFHIGHLFTNAVGESIARLFMMNGADTKRVNYQGDVGLHVAQAIWGLQQQGLTADSELDARTLGQAYAHGATAYRKNEDVQAEIRTINQRLYDRSDEAVNTLYDAGRKVSLAYFESIYQLVDTKFDAYFFESEAGTLGKQLVLDNPEIFPESDGARVFPGEEYGLHTRVFLNREGLPTYEAKELALAEMKHERLDGYDHSVIVTANEVNEYFKVLLRAMSLIYPTHAEKTEHIGHGMVRLTSGKMSSRTGDVIAALDFIADITQSALDKMGESGTTTPDETRAQDIALAAIKYVTLKGSISQDTIFDKEKALSFEGDSGPYLQYTHARICSVLEKAATAGVVPSKAVVPPEPYDVERILYRFPEVITTALAERAPHKVTGYLTELAAAFNTFYAQEKIADGYDQYAPYKAAIADAVRITLANGLWVLAIKAPQQM